MKVAVRSSAPRIIENDSQSDSTGAARQRVRIPYQPDTILFGGWGIKM